MKSINEEAELAKAMYGVYNDCEYTVPTEDDYDILDYVDNGFYYPEEHCHCGEKKRIQDTFCNSCQKAIIDIFKKFMTENFDREELEYLNEVLDGEYIPDYILGRKE